MGCFVEVSCLAKPYWKFGSEIVVFDDDGRRPWRNDHLLESDFCSSPCFGILIEDAVYIVHLSLCRIQDEASAISMALPEGYVLEICAGSI